MARAASSSLTAAAAGRRFTRGVRMARARGIFQNAFRARNLIETAHRRQRPLHPARAQPFAAARGDEGADIGGRQLGQRFFAHRAAQMAALKADEARHIIAIGAQGVGAGAAFMRQRRQPVLSAMRSAASPHALLQRLDGHIAPSWRRR